MVVTAKTLSFIGIAAIFSISAHAAPRYEVHALPPLGNRVPLNAVGINNSGVVAGDSICPGCFSHAFVDSIDLILPGSSYSFAADINEAGQVVGDSSREGGPARAFVYSETNGITDLSPLLGSPSVAHGINNRGEIVGSAYINFEFRAFRLSAGQLTLLDQSLPAKRINDSGVIAGAGYVIDSSGTRPMLFPGGTYSDPFSINSLGQIVGNADNGNGLVRAFLFEDATMTDLGTLGGMFASAQGINVRREIVGFSTLGSDGDQTHRAFLHANGKMTDLNSLIPPNSGWILSEARDINDRGQIVGSGRLNGEHRAFRLDPIPEPPTIVLLAISLTGVACRGRSRRVCGGLV
jgi:probable HAF family extracellular repeat protein